MDFVLNMQQNDSWKRCRVSANDLGGDTKNDADRYDSLCLGLSIFQGCALSISMFIYFVLMFFICMKRNSNGSMDFLVTYFQICLMLFLNHLAIGFGFIFSPCRLGSISNEKSFEIICLTLSTIRFFTVISSFSWKVLEHVYIQFRVAKEYKDRFDKNAQEKEKEREDEIKNKLLEKKRQMFQRQSSDSSISSNRVKRTFSRDIFMIDRGKIRSRQNERIRKQGSLTVPPGTEVQNGSFATVGKLIENLHGFQNPSSQVSGTVGIDDNIGDPNAFFTHYLERWHIKIFLNRLNPETWKVMVVGYLPSIVITLIFSLFRALFIPVHHYDQAIPLNHTNVIDIGYWSSVSGLDVYCSAGTETKFLYDMIPIILGAVFVSGLFYIKSDETVFLCRKMCVGDFEEIIYKDNKWVIDRSYRKMTSISMWAKERPYKRSWQDDQLLRRFKLKQKLSSSLLFVMVTTWILGCLQTLLIWGMCVPYSSVCLLQALTIAIIVPKQISSHTIEAESHMKGTIMKILASFGIGNEEENESESDTDDLTI